MLVTLLRKPLEGTTVSALPCGGLNIHACRVGDSGAVTSGTFGASEYFFQGKGKPLERTPQPFGRFPANVLFEPDCGGTEHFLEVLP